MKEKIKKHWIKGIVVLTIVTLIGWNGYTCMQLSKERKDFSRLAEQLDKMAELNEDLSRENQECVYENDMLDADKRYLEASLDEANERVNILSQDGVQAQETETTADEYSNQVKGLNLQVESLEEQIEQLKIQLVEKDTLIDELKEQDVTFGNSVTQDTYLESQQQDSN